MDLDSVTHIDELIQKAKKKKESRTESKRVNNESMCFFESQKIILKFKNLGFVMFVCKP